MATKFEVSAARCAQAGGNLRKLQTWRGAAPSAGWLVNGSGKADMSTLEEPGNRQGRSEAAQRSARFRVVHPASAQQAALRPC